MSDMLIRYKDALIRLADSKPMISVKESGVGSIECKARILYAQRIIETLNRNDAIELGVVAEMQAQSSDAPIVSETLVGEHPLEQGHED
ncbi:hypothetical protein LCGC14_1006900 [marine sediment metagenome]|uniref:Uncharacterized protein n=1 Tax=marine sediment metagenome TaxID=412755 RepID=A0A0F9QJQ1_9ZZZZ